MFDAQISSSRRCRWRPEKRADNDWIVVERRTGALATDTKFKTDLQAWCWIVNTLDAQRRRERGEA
jgi:hypothetical protein